MAQYLTYGTFASNIYATNLKVSEKVFVHNYLQLMKEYKEKRRNYNDLVLWCDQGGVED